MIPFPDPEISGFQILSGQFFLFWNKYYLSHFELIKDGGLCHKCVSSVATNFVVKPKGQIMFLLDTELAYTLHCEITSSSL